MRLRHLRAPAVVALVAAALLTAGALAGHRPTTSLPPAPAATPASAAGRLDATIARAQERLRDVPRDHATWATLGLAYLEQARITTDPSLYPKAEGALRRSLEIREADNAVALTGLGALANARHDFAAARDLGRRAIDLNPFNAEGYGVLADAYTQLGDAPAATDAVQRMLDLRPGLAAYARGSYDLELRGETAEATYLMRRALDAAVDPADRAFCRNQLGDLAWHAGDLAGAEREYAAGLAATGESGTASYQPLLRGRARVAAARGDLGRALADYAALTARTPTPDTLIEYAELLRLAGEPDEADAQLALAGAAHQLFTANGGSDDLTGALLALAGNRAAEAVDLARREWDRRPFAEVATVAARALRADGRPAEALPFARRAVELGPRDAAAAFELAMAELATGDRDAARAGFVRVRALNPDFSPVSGPLAARALAGLGGAS